MNRGCASDGKSLADKQPANSTTLVFCFCLRVNIRVMKVASKYAGQGLTFSVASKKDFLSELEEDFGLGMSDGGELPVITIRTRTGHKYTMREEFTYVHGQQRPTQDR